MARVSARRALFLLAQMLLESTAVKVAHAHESPRLNLVVSSQCPSRELIEDQLAPLLGERTPELDTSIAIEITDQGENYHIGVGTAEREVHDPRRDCQERAKVSAVFIALNLPARAPEVRPLPAPRPSPPPERPMPGSQTQVGLQLLGAVEYVPELSRAGKGFYAGASLWGGRVELTLHSGIFAPLNVLAAEREGVTYELWRLPSSLTVGFSTGGQALSLGLGGGLAVDVLRLRGVDVPNPDSGVRVNPGFLIALPLRLRANRHVAAVLVPTFTLFPRTYLVRLEPTREVDETPQFWLGARFGMEFSVLGG